MGYGKYALACKLNLTRHVSRW